MPSDVRWVLATRSMGPLADLITELSGILDEHPQLAGDLRKIQAQWEGRLGIWPFDAAGREALGLTDDAKVALYRRPRPDDGTGRSSLGLIIAGVRPKELAHRVGLELRRRGQGSSGQKRVIQVGGRSLLAFGERWVCGYLHGYTQCAEVEPHRFRDEVVVPQTSLRGRALRSLAQADMVADLGVYVIGKPGSWPRWSRELLGELPKGLFAALSVAPRLRLRVFGLGARLAPMWRSPASGSRPTGLVDRGAPALGLAAARGAELAIRLRMSPQGLLDPVKRLGQWGRVVADLVAPEGKDAPRGLASSATGDVLFASWPEGLGIVMGLHDPASAARFLSALDLRLAERLPGWQKRVREMGPGWDLTLARKAGSVSARRELVLQVPAGKGSLFPGVREGRLRLLWAISDEHLLVATDRRVFRRLRAQVSEGDDPFFAEPSSADRSQAFDAAAVFSASLRPDDPLVLLSPVQVGSVMEALADGSPRARSLFLRLRVLFDLVHEINLSLSPHPAGVCLGATVGLAGPSGGRIGPEYREALRRKWGGNLAGHIEALQALGQDDTEGWLREKARRNVPHKDAAPRSGLLGLTASALLPWWARQQRSKRRSEPRVMLARLGERLRAMAAEVSSSPPSVASRWHRALTTTPLTPARRCCGSPDRQCVSEAKDWRHVTWQRLGFAVTGHHRYQYEVVVRRGSVRTTLLLRAVGDLDCDGRLSVVQLPVHISSSTGALTLGTIQFRGVEDRLGPRLP